MMISTGKDENEILTIQVNIGDEKVRIINGYGPQEDDNQQSILGFWQELEAEVINAKENECMVVIELDANAKVGKNTIRDDPNHISGNGKIMMDIIERQKLVIANSEEMCKGLITREREVEKKVERSIIDYILMCEKMQRFLIEMTIDDERIHVLHRHIKTKSGTRLITSDHNILFSKYCITFNRKPRKIRTEIFQFKCEESKRKFYEETSSNSRLSSCFSSSHDFESGANKFFKLLNRLFHKCFKKIRIRTGSRKPAGDDSIQGKLKLRTELKVFITNNKCKIAEQIAKSRLEKIESELAAESAANNAKFVKDIVQNVETSEGKFSNSGFWKIKQRFVPGSVDPPMAKHDKHGNIVTAPSALKNLYIETYKERLKQREMKLDLLDVYCLKTELWMSRLEKMKKIRSSPWNQDNLDHVLKSLKNNKTRDPNGMIHEIFKAGCIGSDLKEALLNLFNGVKANQFQPMFMTLCNITTIFKKGSRFDLNNDRGIFILTVFQKILDKLLYYDNYEDLNDNMSDSNIGARRKRNIKDHLLIVHGIINSVVHGGEDCIDIQIYDLEKAFDALWLEECLNDIVDTLPEHKMNDKISLIYESNKDNLVAVKTALGLTERVNIPNIVQQGGTWGSMLCSNTVDTIGKKCRDRGEHCYYYKKTARILPLGFVDDINGIAKCGMDSIALNTFITTQIELKRLKFHVPDKQGKTKCHKLHIGKNHNMCPTLKVHGTVMPEVMEDTYLGDILSNDGRNTKNIKNRISKGVGCVNQIFNILENIVFGPHYFEIAVLLRASLLINGIMTNAEIWYNVSKSEIEDFEALDRLFFRRLFEVPSSTPKEAYYLELGVLPINILLKARRINYLYSLLNQNKTGMLYTFFITQWYNPCKGDWTLQVQEDLADFQIPCSFETIAIKSKEAFKNLVKTRAKELALKQLVSKQERHSKMENLYYSELKLQTYLKTDETSIEQKKMLFRNRVRMEQFGENYRGGKDQVLCPLCNLHLDNQEMAFQCPEVRKSIKVEGSPKEIFQENIREETIKTIQRIMALRKQTLENR